MAKDRVDQQPQPGIQDMIHKMAQILQRIAVQQQQRQYQTPEQILESLFLNIIEFVFDEENGVTFGRCCLTATRTSSRTMQAS